MKTKNQKQENQLGYTEANVDKAQEVLQEESDRKETSSTSKFEEENILQLFKKLNKQDKENIYSLVWSLTAKDLLYNIAKQQLGKIRGEQE